MSDQQPQYVLEVKAKPMPPAPANVPDPNAPVDPADVPDQQEEQDNAEWAGDLDESGDETDPANAFAAFQSDDGTEGWLDRSDDGTLTGWVRTPDGTVYRYTDVNAWAVDVDDAKMPRVDAGYDPTAALPEETPGDENAPADDPTDPQAQPDASQSTSGDDEVPYTGDPADAEPTDPNPADDAADPNAQAQDQAAQPVPDASQDPEATDPEDIADGGADEATEDESDDEIDPVTGKPKKKKAPPFQTKGLAGALVLRVLPRR